MPLCPRRAGLYVYESVQGGAVWEEDVEGGMHRRRSRMVARVSATTGRYGEDK